MKNKYDVMIVDDDRMFNMINEKIMRISKFSEKIDVYSDANEALAQLKKIMETNVTQFPDVMFIDVNMPGMDGWQFLDRLNKFPEFVTGKCKIYMLTSSIDQSDIDKAMGYQVVSSLISKPLTISLLEKMMAEEPVLEMQLI